MKNLFWIACIAVFAIGCSGGDKEPETTGGTGSTTAGKPTPGMDGGTPAPGATTATYIDVQEIFTSSCAGCHGDTDPKGGLSLTSYEGLMKGAADGPVIVAGDPEKSKLVMALHGSNGIPQMPKGSAPLADDKIKKIEDWVKAGAKKEPG